MRAWLIAAAFVSMAGAASASFVDGNFLHDTCQSSRNFATGYVLGAVDAIQTANENGFVSRNFCLRPSLTAGQLTDVTCQALAQYPELRDLPALALTSTALQMAFPCQ